MFHGDDDPTADELARWCPVVQRRLEATPREGSGVVHTAHPHTTHVLSGCSVSIRTRRCRVCNEAVSVAMPGRATILSPVARRARANSPPGAAATCSAWSTHTQNSRRCGGARPCRRTDPSHSRDVACRAGP